MHCSRILSRPKKSPNTCRATTLPSVNRAVSKPQPSRKIPIREYKSRSFISLEVRRSWIFVTFSNRVFRRDVFRNCGFAFLGKEKQILFNFCHNCNNKWRTAFEFFHCRRLVFNFEISTHVISTLWIPSNLPLRGYLLQKSLNVQLINHIIKLTSVRFHVFSSA